MTGLRPSRHQAYRPPPWERACSVAAAAVGLGVVLYLVVRNQPFSDPNFVVMTRIILSLSVAVLGATVPGFLNVSWSAKGSAVRAGGALALFVLTFLLTPQVVQQETRGDNRAAISDVAGDIKCSPANFDTKGGDVSIVCNDVDPQALDRLNELLNKKDLELAQMVREAEDWARRYRELTVQVTDLGETGELAQEVNAALKQGELETAGTLLFNGYYNLGNRYRRDKHYDMAILNYEQAIKSASLTGAHDHFGAHYNLADSYRKIGDVKSAIEHYQKAIEVAPDDPKANYNLGNMYQQNGEYDLAKRYYLRVMELEEKGSELWRRAQENLK